MNTPAPDIMDDDAERVRLDSVQDTLKKLDEVFARHLDEDGEEEGKS